MSVCALPHDPALKLRAKLKEMRDAAHRDIAILRPEADTNMLRGDLRTIDRLLAWLDPPSAPTPEPPHRRLSGQPNY